MTYEEFMDSTMFVVKERIRAFYERKKEDLRYEEYIAWVGGYYIAHAIGINFSKKAKYPENPLKTEEPINYEELSKEELTELQEKYLLQLDFMARNATKDR